MTYAAQLLAGSVPRGDALLHYSSSPVSLYRMSGFPALLAVLEIISAKFWPYLLVLLQIAAQSSVVLGTWWAARRFGAKPPLALAAALLPAIGFAVVLNICVLTDALCDAAVAGAALLLLLYPNWSGALLAGLLLAGATSFREATLFLVICYIPLALRASRRWLCAFCIILPAWAVGAAQVNWNIARGAGPILTTSQQIVMVQAILPLLQHHVPVYDYGQPFDRIGNETVGAGGYARIAEMQRRLFTETGLTAPEIAHEASRRYFLAWQRFPLAMLSATLSNFNPVFLEMPFQPLGTVNALVVYQRHTRPDFVRLNIQWRNLRKGDVAALGWLALNFICNGIGGAIFLAGTILPWLPWKTLPKVWDLRAAWCVPAGLICLYLPVHLETRYVTPAIPLLCLIAAVCLSALPIAEFPLARLRRSAAG